MILKLIIIHQINKNLIKEKNIKECYKNKIISQSIIKIKIHIKLIKQIITSNYRSKILKDINNYNPQQMLKPKKINSFH